ncbi:MAG: AAA family ATPase, CDC48 subfamily [halophilic archaeon J07HX64]|nr:MAG: AAA family ATPase, CDC48 subfamily [halophilic archaeon J07HX64]
MCMSDGTAEVRVEGARKQDAGRGIARLPTRLQSSLGVLSGDPIIIEGERLTVAKVWPGDDDDVIRIDGDTRASVGVNIGGRVTVRKASVNDAIEVTLHPASDHASQAPAEQIVRRKLVDRLVRTGKQLRIEGYGPYVVTDTTPAGSVRITESTGVKIDPEQVSVGEESPGDTESTDNGGEAEADGLTTDTTYEDIGGLDEELELVREMIELPLSEPELFTRLGIEPPKGVLLYGPPGTGKTLIARAVANEVDAHFDTIHGPEIVSKYKGESAERLRTAFERASENAPAIIFLDELDSIAGERDDSGDMENRVVAQLLTLLDGLDSDEQVVVIGATNRVDAIDPAIRRGGRFDREIEIGVPDETGRREILDVHTRDMPLADDVRLDELAERLHGFVGADIASLAREAGMAALRRGERPAATDDTGAEEMRVAREDFQEALTGIEPSGAREYVAESPTTKFTDVGGLGETKARLREAVEWPLAYEPLFRAAATDPPSGVLLHGPPGTGKTLLAEAIAGESGVNFVRVAGPEVLDQYVGESEQAIRDLFDRARQTAPAIVFMDEVDAIASRRGEGHEVTERVVSQLLTELDRAADHPNLVVLAATNRKDDIDPALLRPGRLEQHIEVPNPDEHARTEILGVHTEGTPLGDGVDLGALAAETAGYSGAEVEALVREASMRAIREVAAKIDPDEAEARADEVTIDREHVTAAREAVDNRIADSNEMATESSPALAQELLDAVENEES